MEEIWKDIEGYEGIYQVSNTGRVKKLANVSYRLNRWGTITEYHQAEKLLIPALDGKKNYLFISLSKDGIKILRTVHRLVAETFIPNPHKYKCVNHKDEVKTNNRVDNLEWCTYHYNNQYGKNTRSKRLVQMDKQGNVIAKFESTRDAAKEMGVDHVSIAAACRGKTKTIRGFCWKYIE